MYLPQARLHPSNGRSLDFKAAGEEPVTTRPRIYVAYVDGYNFFKVVKEITECDGFEEEVPPTKGWSTCRNFTGPSYKPGPVIGMGIIGDRLYYGHRPDQFIRSCLKENGTDCQLLRYAPSKLRMVDMGVWNLEQQPIRRVNGKSLQ